MPTTVAINGFGRMGRLSLRVLFDRFPEMEVVAINEHAGTAKCAAHLLKYDSVHGRWDRDVDSTDSTIVVGTTVISFTSSTNLEGLGWKDIHIDIVLECTGAYRTPAKLQSYFDQGCTKVIVACPVKEGALNVVYGCNDGQYDPATHNLLTAASCTTNAVAPVVKVLQEKIGIKHGQITTMHDTTNTQNVVDAPHKDLRRARANSMSLIPTTTGSATAITMIYPELKGKLNGLAVRVPLLNASLVDCVFEMDREVTVAEVNQFLTEASKADLQGVLGVETKPLVSIDYVNDPRSGIVDALSTMVVNGTSLKVLVWYDNEWGYVNRMLELTSKVALAM